MLCRADAASPLRVLAVHSQVAYQRRRDLLKHAGKPVILVTGSEGTIGDAIVNWEYPNYDIASFDIARPHKRPDVQDFIDCDLTSDESVNLAMKTLREKHGNKLAAYYDF